MGKAFRLKLSKKGKDDKKWVWPDMPKIKNLGNLLLIEDERPVYKDYLKVKG